MLLKALRGEVAVTCKGQPVGLPWRMAPKLKGARREEATRRA